MRGLKWSWTDSSRFWGWGFAQIWRRFFLCFFFSGFHLPERGDHHTDLWYAEFCADFCADFVRRFLSRFSERNAQILVQIFAQIFRRFFFGVLALQKEVFQSHAKIRANSAEKSAASQGPVPGGVPTPFPLPGADGLSHNSRQAQAVKESV